MKIVIIGGVAAGASMAARARRLSESAEITVIERGPDVSFANCGLPYYIGGEIQDRSRLALQTPASLKAMLHVEVKVLTEALAIDRANKLVTLRSVQSGETSQIAYDKLVLAPGASPLRPPMPGFEDARILTLRNLQDMDRIAQAAETAQRCLVIGGGFIGLEMAEQLQHRGKQVTLVELQNQVLPPMDKDMADHVEKELVDNGIEVLLGDAISGFESLPGGLGAKLKSGRTLETDLVILSIGVKPESQLAADAGLELGGRGAIKVNDWMQTSDPDIYAAGDVIEHKDRILGQPMNLPLGGPANRQGRTIADHIFLPEGQRQVYPGHVGTAIVRVFDLTAAATGWSEKRLQQAGTAYETATVSDFQHASYYPGATDVTLKILWEKDTGRILGAQAVGADGVDKRIDVVATAIVGRMTIDDLVHLELAYAPPFGSARDIVNTAGFVATNMRNGLFQPARAVDSNRQLLDVRPGLMAQTAPMDGGLNIPLPELRGRLNELPAQNPVLTACAKGKTSYFASRILSQHGYDTTSLVGGLKAHPELLAAKPAPAPTAGDISEGATKSGGTACCGLAAPAAASSVAVAAPLQLDATGLACPGPLMRVQQAATELQPGQELHIKASDGGFKKDIAAFCQSAGMELLEVDRVQGVIQARIRRPLTEAPVPAGGAHPASHKDTTIIVFSQDLDKALASFVIANGGKAMGGEVTMFFTFWGLNVLRKEHAVPVAGKTFMDKLFGWMMPRGMKALPLSNMHMAGMGTAMMKGRMASKNLPNLPGLLKSAQESGVKFVACSMSMDAMGIRLEELIDGVEVGGVADMLAASRTSSATLFV